MTKSKAIVQQFKKASKEVAKFKKAAEDANGVSND